MKTIENKTTSLVLKADDKGQPVFATYADLVSIVINFPVQGGFTITQIKQRLTILAACEVVGEVILLEDIDLTLVRTLVTEFKWTQVNKDIVNFNDDLNNIK